MAYQRRNGGGLPGWTSGSKPVFPLPEGEFKMALDWEFVAVQGACERLETETRHVRRWKTGSHIAAVREVAGLLTGELTVPRLRLAVGAARLSLGEWLSQDPILAGQPTPADVQRVQLLEASCELQARVWAENCDRLAKLAIRRKHLRYGLELCRERLQRLEEAHRSLEQQELETIEQKGTQKLPGTEKDWSLASQELKEVFHGPHDVIAEQQGLTWLLREPVSGLHLEAGMVGRRMAVSEGMFGFSG